MIREIENGNKCNYCVLGICSHTFYIQSISKGKGKGKAVPLQALTGSEVPGG
jgi:hypothetical protein